MSTSTVLVSRVGVLQLRERLLLVGMLHQKVGAAVCSSHLQGCITLGSHPRAGCPLFFFFHPQENQNEISSLKIWFWKERLISCWDDLMTSLSACPRIHKPVNSWEWGSTPSLPGYVFTAAVAVHGNPSVLIATTQSIVSQHHETISLIISQERVVFFTKLHCNSNLYQRIIYSSIAMLEMLSLF